MTHRALREPYLYRRRRLHHASAVWFSSSSTTTNSEYSGATQHQVELFANRAHIVECNKANRFLSTGQAYRIRFVRWTKWCLEEKGYENDLVTADRVLLYLRTNICAEVSQNKGKRSGGEKRTTVRPSTVDGHVSALCSLWEEQKHANPPIRIDTPRDYAVKRYLKGLQRQEHTVKRAAYTDRGIGTIHDGSTSGRWYASATSVGRRIQ